MLNMRFIELSVERVAFEIRIATRARWSVFAIAQASVEVRAYASDVNFGACTFIFASFACRISAAWA